MQKIIYLIISLIFSFQLNGQWLQTNGPEGAEVYDLERIDAEIWAATDAGLFISTNEGATWNLASFLPFESDVRTIFKEGSEIFLTVSVYDYSYNFSLQSFNHYLYRSVNNGVSWVSYDLPITHLSPDEFGENVQIYRIGSSLFFKRKTDLFRSNNNGVSWQQVNVPEDILYITSDGNRILAASSQTIYISNDKGVSWQVLENFGTYRNLWMEDQQIIITNSIDNEFLISEDLGSTWTIIDAPGGYSIYPRWKRGNSGKLYYMDRLVYASEDNGLSWDTLNSITPFIWRVRDVIELSDEKILTGTSHGLFTVENNDQIWSASNTNLLGTTATDFKSLPNGDILAKTGLGYFQTNNNGNDWFGINQPPASISLEKSMVTVGDSIYFHQGDGQFILSTANLNILDTIIGDISFFSYIPKFKYVNNRFYLIGRFSHQSDDLITWDSLIIDAPNSSWPHRIDDLIFTEDGALLASVDRGRIHRSIDNGVSWNLVFENPTAGARPIYFYKIANRIFIVGASGWYSSPDQGVSWSSVTMNGAQTDNGFFPIKIAHTDNVIFAILFGRGVYRSNDLGENWELYNEGLDNLRSFEIFYSNGYLYYGSFASGVWRREVENDMVSTEDNFIISNLLQISPNPSTNRTYLALKEEQQGFGILDVFDVQGRLILQRNLNLGLVPQKIDLEKISPGVYFVKYSVDKKFYIEKLVVQ